MKKKRVMARGGMKTVATFDRNEEVKGIVNYRGHILIATTKAVYELTQKGVKPLKFKKEKAGM